MLVLLSLVVPALADPCGMVPPVYLGDGPPITRVGHQQTYVFYKRITPRWDATVSHGAPAEALLGGYR